MTADHSSLRPLTPEDGEAAVALINAAAGWYREFLGTEATREPEMTLDEWGAEAQRMTWFGAFEGDVLAAVMGLEYVGDAALLRHAYVLPHRQRHGIGARLHRHLEERAQGVERIIVGTYAANFKARRALESFGYSLSPDPAAILRRYYDIPDDRLESSVTYEKDLSPGR